MRFAILLTGDSTEYAYARYGTYADMFIAQLKREGDQWDVFDVRNFDYPRDLTIYDGYIITGSSSTAHEKLPWIRCLNLAVEVIYKANVKILGVCFGHQVVANALGGKSGPNKKGWEIGVHELKLAPAFFQQPFAEGIKSNLKILQTHRDHVIEPPEGANVLASTDHTPVQIFKLGDNVLAIQGHPEYAIDTVKDLVEARLEYGFIPKAVGKAALRSMEEQQPDSEALTGLIQNFLRGS